MKKKVLSVLLCALVVGALVLLQYTEPAKAVEEIVPFVTDSTTTADAVLEAWKSGSHSYVKLGADLTLPMTEGEIIDRKSVV